MTTTDATPLLQVSRGNPTPEELAALTTTVLALAAATPHPAPARHPAWNDPARLLRTPLHPGPNAWQQPTLNRF